jgi:hypothetical protein
MIMNWLLNKADEIENIHKSAMVLLTLVAIFMTSFFAILWKVCDGTIMALPFVISVLVVSEVFFWCEKPKPKRNQNKMEFTLGRKLLSAIDAFIINGYVFAIFIFKNEIINFFIGIYLPFLTTIMWLGVAVLGIIGLYGLVWLNSKKYRNVKYPKKPVKRKKV